MKKEAIENAVKQAAEFIARAEDLFRLTTTREVEGFNGEIHVFTDTKPKESGSLRRQSMELTRSLAEMRKP